MITGSGWIFIKGEDFSRPVFPPAWPTPHSGVVSGVSLVASAFLPDSSDSIVTNRLQGFTRFV